jgi:hypothetical protein
MVDRILALPLEAVHAGRGAVVIANTGHCFLGATKKIGFLTVKFYFFGRLCCGFDKIKLMG